MNGEVPSPFEVFSGRYDDGYYRYFVLITFKDNTPYADSHPKNGWDKFKRDIWRYLEKHNVVYEMHPELSSNGRLHCHAFMCFKANKLIENEKQYDYHEAELRLMKNYIRRKFGMNTFNRSYSYRLPYEVSDVRWQMRKYQATWQEGYDYMVKDDGKYPFMTVFKNT